MKHLFLLLSALSLAMVLSLKADFTNDTTPFDPKIYANSVRSQSAINASTNLAILPAGLVYFFEKDFGTGTPTYEFKADEMICSVMTVRRYNRVMPRDPDSMLLAGMASSNTVWYRGLPSVAQAVDIQLRDDKGREVPKTAKGLANISQAPTPPGSTFVPPGSIMVNFDRHFNFGRAHWPLQSIHEFFRPSDYFVITNKGTYEMTVKVRIYAPMTNGVPDTNAMTDSRPNTSRINDNFGIVESTPLCVKVIKE